MSSSERKAKKGALMKKLYERFSKHKQIILVNLMNVGSNQVQAVRREMNKRRSDLIIGKNTVIRKVIDLRKGNLDKHMDDYDFYKQFGPAIPQLEKLQERMKKKVGLLFTDEPVYEVKPIIESNKVQTQARVGVIAPCDVVIPAGPTGLDPSQISFFHALHLTTKIQKGQIELVTDVKVITKGNVVGNSEAILLQKLNIKPFLYGMEIVCVYDDGSILTPEVVGLSPNDILAKFSQGVANITALSLELGIPTECSIPHMIANAFKNLAAISVTTGYKLEALENLQSSQPAQQQQAHQEAPKDTKKKEEPKKEEPPAEEVDVDMGDLFG